MNEMVARFQRCRWSPTRKLIDAMKVGQVETFKPDESNLVYVSVSRMNEAYDGEKIFEYKCTKQQPRVTRIT